MSRTTVIPLLLGGLLILSSCAESAHQVFRNAGHIDVPPELEKQIDTSVTFADLQAAPGNYVGRVVMVGGVVIKAKAHEHTVHAQNVLEVPHDRNGAAGAHQHGGAIELGL